MKYQTKAFQISFLLHSLIFALVVIMSTFLGQSKKVMILDFQLQRSQPPEKKVEMPPPVPVLKTRPVIKPQKPTIKESPPPQEERPRASPSPETPPMVKLPVAPSLDSRPMGLAISEQQSKDLKEGSPGIPGGVKDGTGTGSGTGTGPGSGTADAAKESVRNKYLKDHFAYIRDRIIRNITYPEAARRLGWQGRVLISFIITTEGSVRECRIIQSSGFPLLDKSAVETVKDTAPFPKPPGEAQLVIPITYRLN